MSCPCIQSDPIGVCAQSVTIGVIADVLTDVSVYIKNLSTGRFSKFETTSDINGYVAIDTTDFLFGENMNYQATITLSGQPMGSLIEFTVGSNTGTCVWFSAINLDGFVWALGSVAAQTDPSIVRYRQIAADAGWIPSIWVTDITDTSSLVTITLESPANYELGQDYTLSDISGAASLNNPKLVGPFVDGAAFKEITSDRGSIVFQSTGTAFKLVVI